MPTLNRKLARGLTTSGFSGLNLLVAPVMEQGAAGRPVRLPEGCWKQAGKGRKLKGGRTIQVEAPLDTLPWFTRCGTSPLRG